MAELLTTRRDLAAAQNTIAMRDSEIERWREATRRLRSEMEHQSARANTAEVDLAAARLERDEAFVARDFANLAAERADKPNNALERKVAQLRSDLAAARAELEGNAWDVSPAMAQAKIDQLNNELGNAKEHAENLQHLLNEARQSLVWHGPQDKPPPLVPGVGSDRFLTLDLSGWAEMLYYIYGKDQWTFGEGDTQRVAAWLDTRKLITEARASIARKETKP